MFNNVYMGKQINFMNLDIKDQNKFELQML